MLTLYASSSFFFINILILSFYSYIYTKKTKYSVCMYMGLFIIHVSIFILNLIYKKLIQIFADIMKPKIIIIYTLNLIGEFYVAHVITTRYLQHSEIDKKKKVREKSLRRIFLIKKENFYHFLIEPDIIIMHLSFFYTISI